MKDSISNIVEAMIDRGFLVCQESMSQSKKYFRNIPLYISEDNEDATMCLMPFFQLCIKYNLPFCNPIAFFNRLLNEDYYQDISPLDLHTLLKLAIGGEGFVFSTSFDQSGSSLFQYKRPANFAPNINRRKFQNTVHLQAQFTARHQYHSDQMWLQDAVFGPAKECRKHFWDWLVLRKKEEESASSSKKTQAPYRFLLSYSSYEKIFIIYRFYCAKQVTERYLKDLDIAIDSMKLILELHKFYVELYDILSQEGDVAEKRSQWLNRFRQYLISDELKGKLDNADKISNEATVSLLGLKDYIACAKQKEISFDRKNTYPLWDEGSDIKIGLGKGDKEVLTHYQKHPLFTWLKGIDEEFQSPTTREIAPWYLMTQLINKESPTNLFYRKPQQLSSMVLKFNPKYSVNDEPSRDYQLTHRVLLKDLIEAFYQEENKKLWRVSEKLCTFLFLRHNSFSVQRTFKKMSDEEFLEAKLGWEPIQVLMVHIEEMLSLKQVSLPEYASLRSAPGGQMALSHYSRDELTQHTKIVKLLQKLITPEMATEYCDMVLTPARGLGIGIHPKEWHLRLANWMQAIIDSDEKLIAYVEPEETMPHYGQAMTIVEFNKHVGEKGKGPMSYSARMSPHLAQVEVTIQRLCIEMVVKNLQTQVFMLYKQAFF